MNINIIIYVSIRLNLYYGDTYIMSKRNKIKKVVPYNERERNAKVINLLMELSELGMRHIITPEINQHMNDFVKLGKNYVDCIDLPRLARQMIISLINDKHQKTFIHFKYTDPEPKEDKCCETKDCETKCCE